MPRSGAAPVVDPPEMSCATPSAHPRLRAGMPVWGRRFHKHPVVNAAYLFFLAFSSQARTKCQDVRAWTCVLKQLVRDGAIAWNVQYCRAVRSLAVVGYSPTVAGMSPRPWMSDMSDVLH